MLAGFLLDLTTWLTHNVLKRLQESVTVPPRKTHSEAMSSVCSSAPVVSFFPFTDWVCPHCAAQCIRVSQSHVLSQKQVAVVENDLQSFFLYLEAFYCLLASNFSCEIRPGQAAFVLTKVSFVIPRIRFLYSL